MLLLSLVSLSFSEYSVSRHHGRHKMPHETLEIENGMVKGLELHPYNGDSISGVKIYRRGGNIEEYERLVVLPEPGNQDVHIHLWTYARFTAEIMAEHALFFALLIPKEIEKNAHSEALLFYKEFAHLYNDLNKLRPGQDEDKIKQLVKKLLQDMEHFIEYKKQMGKKQETGELRSFVWPLFFDHTRHEAERHHARIKALDEGKIDYEYNEVVKFWTKIMAEHADFVAHLLDPQERQLFNQALKTGRQFYQLYGASPQKLETEGILEAAKNILEFKTEAARKVAAAQIKSIIDPRLADHVRREALKFINEYEHLLAMKKNSQNASSPVEYGKNETY